MAAEKNKSKKPASIKDVKLNYLTGKPFDGKTLRGAFGFLGTMLLMTFAFLLLGMALVMENSFLRIAFNSVILLMTLMLFYQNGAVRGTTDANLGEMMYDRQMNGYKVDAADQASCFHPVKGFVVALLGSIPMLICALLLASVATRQMTSMGALPSWVASFEGRSEIGNALAFYHQEVSMSMEDILRIFIRMSMMPVVNIVSGYGADAMLVLERLSALVLLMPALVYGLGYTTGVKQRKLVHLGIAEGEKKRRKKERRQKKTQQRQRQQRTGNGPGQLN